jgi:hypothetical protein
MIYTIDDKIVNCYIIVLLYCYILPMLIYLFYLLFKAKALLFIVISLVINISLLILIIYFLRNIVVLCNIKAILWFILIGLMLGIFFIQSNKL